MFDHEAGKTEPTACTCPSKTGMAGQCQFLEADLKTPLPKRLHFTSSDVHFAHAFPQISREPPSNYTAS